MEANEVGLIQLRYDPPVSYVPDWTKLWGESELAKLSEVERDAHEEALTTLLSVRFLKNSEELE